MHASANPTPSWPADMVVRVAINPLPLIELLWIRQCVAGGLGPDLPAVANPAPGSQAQAASGYPSDAAQRWSFEWSKTLEQIRLAQESDPADVRSSRELWEVPHPTDLAEMFNVDLAGVPDWVSTLDSADSAELDSASAVRAAWERGLRVILELPFAGGYSASLSPKTLLLSAVTRASSSKFEKALEEFSNDVPPRRPT